MQNQSYNLKYPDNKDQILQHTLPKNPDKMHEIILAAASNSDIEFLTALKQKDPDILESVKPNNGGATLTPLMVAAESENIPALSTLLSAGANIDYRNNDGDTALMFAARSGRAKSLQSLIRSGAELDTQNRYRNSALHLAVSGHHPNCVRILCKSGAFLESLSSFGETPFEKAATQHAEYLKPSDLESIEALIDAGAHASPASGKNKEITNDYIKEKISKRKNIINRLIKNLKKSSQEAIGLIPAISDKDFFIILKRHFILEKQGQPETFFERVIRFFSGKSFLTAETQKSILQSLDSKQYPLVQAHLQSKDYIEAQENISSENASMSNRTSSNTAPKVPLSRCPSSILNTSATSKNRLKSN